MKRRSNLLLYLILNVIVSAATTLGVLVIWDNVKKAQAPAEPPAAQVAGLPGDQAAAPAAQSAATLPALTPSAAAPYPTLGPTDTLPPAGQAVIQILSVVGVGDLDQEVVLLKRAGEGNIHMVGWKLQGQNNNVYTFPAQPDLVLYKDGAVQIYTKAGTDTATDVYWNRSAAAWRSGETIRLLDPQGIERATYRVP